MTESFILNNNKKFWILSTIFIILLISPVVYFGIKDQEAYQLHFFSLGFHLKDLKNFFIDYVDFYGPGTFLATLEEDKLSFPNIFFFNVQLYYLFKLLFYIWIQTYFLNKIFILFKIKNKIFIIYSIFSIANFNYIYSDDWHTIFSYSFFFPILYYLLKFYLKKKPLDFFCLIFFISYQMANGHFGNIILHYIFLFIFILLQRDFFFIKKKYFYFGMVLFFFIIFYKIYSLTNQYLQFPENLSPVTQAGYNFKDLFFSLERFNRSPFYGIINYVALYYSIKMIIYKQSKKILYLDIFFIILFTTAFIPILENFFFISSAWKNRDLFNVISIILVAQMFKENDNSNFKIIFHLLTIFFIFFMIFKNVYFNIDFSKNNFIANNVKDKKLLTALEDISLNNKSSRLNKTYLSNDVYSFMRGGFSNYGIYAVTDLIKYQLFPFNGWFKYSSKDNIWPSKSQLHGEIGSNYKNFNNEIYLDFFLIDKLIFFKNEKNNINIKLKILKEIKLELIGKTLIIAQREFTPLKYIGEKKENPCERIKNINCILNENFFTNESNIKISSKKINTVDIHNNDSKSNYFIFPFTEPDNWNFKKNNANFTTNKLNDFKIIKLNPNSKYSLNYFNKVGFYSNMISIIFQLSYFLVLILLKRKNKNKNYAS